MYLQKLMPKLVLSSRKETTSFINVNVSLLFNSTRNKLLIILKLLHIFSMVELFSGPLVQLVLVENVVLSITWFAVIKKQTRNTILSLIMNFMRQSIRDSKLNQIIQKVFMLTLRTHWVVMYLMKVTGEILDVMKIQLIGMSLITSLKEIFHMLMLLKQILIRDLHLFQNTDGTDSIVYL